MGSNGHSSESQTPKSNVLARQGSLYNLTLDEVQHQLGDLGKPLSSMNLDELLKTVWTAEANQGLTGGQPDSTHHVQPSSLARQSSLTLSHDIRKRTVDEVWQDIQQGHNSKNNTKNSNADKKGSRERQATLGEMTLEDFLVKAGIVAGSSSGKKNTDASVTSVIGVD